MQIYAKNERLMVFRQMSFNYHIQNKTYFYAIEKQQNCTKIISLLSITS